MNDAEFGGKIDNAKIIIILKMLINLVPMLMLKTVTFESPNSEST